MAMPPTDETQFPKRTEFDISNVESPMWHFYARAALPKKPFTTTVTTPIPKPSPVASQAPYYSEANPFHPQTIKDKQSVPFSQKCLGNDLMLPRAYVEGNRATSVAEEGDLRDGIDLLSVLTSSNGRPLSVPPPLNLLTMSVEAVGRPGDVGSDRCSAGKEVDAADRCAQGPVPDIDTSGDSEDSLACHDGSCEPLDTQETQCMPATSPHRTGALNSSRVQTRVLNSGGEKPETPLQFPACGPAIVLALDPALEEGCDTWSVTEETIAAHDEARAPSIGSRSFGWLGQPHRNMSDEGNELSLWQNRFTRNDTPSENEAVGGKQKRSWNLGQQQSLLPPLNMAPRRVPVEMNLALFGDHWQRSNVSVCHDMQNFPSRLKRKWFGGY